MSPKEFTDALCFSMGLPDGQIVGFKDATGKYYNYHLLHMYVIGLIITPSQACKYPEVLRPDPHDIMLR